MRAGATRWAGPCFAVLLLVSVYVLFDPDPAGSGAGPPGTDKVVHATLFALLTLTAALRWGARPAVLVAALLYGATSELVQGVALPDRTGDLLDLLADAVGATAGWLVAGPMRLTPPDHG